jgi:CheY-like chemotaxis protein
MSQTPQAAGLRVLVVDDCPDTGESYRSLLRLWGYDARVAADGASALAAYEDYHPDVVFLDLGMPGMDGCEVARRLRARQGRRRLFLVCLSGWASDEDRRRSKEAGCDAHWAKPADPEALHRLLDSCAAKAPLPFIDRPIPRRVDHDATNLF